MDVVMASIIFLIMNNKVELLAPCGTYDSFTAAIKAGADAVYLGLNKFGARAGAGNFSIEEFAEALCIAHTLDKKVYLTVNTLFKENEMGELFSFIEEPYKLGLDGVIVQDLGVMKFISHYFPLLPIHASTQAAITSSYGFESIKEFNVTRVVPARELSLEEIKEIKNITKSELECFIHGALCYSVSGKCLFSSFLGGRSGNRGRCAQPCRLMYNDKYLLSMKDLCTIDNIPEFITAGISSFKIEGRMKSPEYVYGVTSIYRKYIDLHYSGNKYTVDATDKEKLLSLYTRSGNCSGYYYKHNSKNMITVNSPSYNSTVDSKTVDLSDIKLPKRTVNISAEIHLNENVAITVSDGKIIAKVTTDVIPQEALNQALTIDLVKKQFSKTGNTPLDIDRIDINIDDNLFLSNGQLNSIRRCAIVEYLKLFNAQYERTLQKRNLAASDSKSDCVDSMEDCKTASGQRDVNISVLNLKQLSCALKYKGVSGLIIPCFLILSLDEITLNEVLTKISDGKKKLYLQLPIVFRKEEKCDSAKVIDESIKRIQRSNTSIAGVYISNFEEITYIKDKYDLDLIGDIHTYVYNSKALSAYKELGVKYFTAPVELTLKELLSRDFANEELIIYGRMPMMVSFGCVENNQKGCKYNKEGHLVRIFDRKNASLPVFCNCAECCNYIFNSVPTYLADKKSELLQLNLKSYRIMFTDEDFDTCKAILDLIFDSQSNTELKYNPADFEHTRGHFNKGID